MSHVATLPLVSCHRMSLLPSPLKSWVLVVSAKRPIWLALFSVNHRAPSGPLVMYKGPLLTVGIGYSVNTPAVVMRPILVAGYLENQRPPAPAVLIAVALGLAGGPGAVIAKPVVVG